jgi:hypothetical protein
LYVLDGLLRPVGIGISGELYISGAGVARGYLHRPELTSERFISNPFTDASGHDRLYRTGDIVRWLSDGNLEYLGRADDQVKIRGYRIELGEIESVLQGYVGISQSVVLAQPDGHGGKRLVGYVVLSGEPLDREGLLSHMREQLPEYMVPVIYVELPTLPLTRNGKIDKRSLPLPEAGDLQQSGSYVAARNSTEAELCRIWSVLLNVERVGIDDNFFALGGHSIITIQVVSRARRSGINLHPRDIFRNQTIRLLAGMHLSSGPDTAEQGHLTGESALLPIQSWFLESGHSAPSHYNQDLLLRISKSADEAMVRTVLEGMVSRHDGLRFRYHEGSGTWHQAYAEESLSLWVQEIGETADAEVSISLICSQAQSSLDISSHPSFIIDLQFWIICASAYNHHVYQFFYLPVR